MNFRAIILVGLSLSSAASAEFKKIKVGEAVTALRSPISLSVTARDKIALEALDCRELQEQMETLDWKACEEKREADCKELIQQAELARFSIGIPTPKENSLAWDAEGVVLTSPEEKTEAIKFLRSSFAEGDGHTGYSIQAVARTNIVEVAGVKVKFAPSSWARKFARLPLKTKSELQQKSGVGLVSVGKDLSCDLLAGRATVEADAEVEVVLDRQDSDPVLKDLDRVGQSLSKWSWSEPRSFVERGALAGFRLTSFVSELTEKYQGRAEDNLFGVLRIFFDSSTGLPKQGSPIDHVTAAFPGRTNLPNQRMTLEFSKGR